MLKLITNLSGPDKIQQLIFIKSYEANYTLSHKNLSVLVPNESKLKFTRQVLVRRQHPIEDGLAP